MGTVICLLTMEESLVGNRQVFSIVPTDTKTNFEIFTEIKVFSLGLWLNPSSRKLAFHDGCHANLAELHLPWLCRGWRMLVLGQLGWSKSVPALTIGGI